MAGEALIHNERERECNGTGALVLVACRSLYPLSKCPVRRGQVDIITLPIQLQESERER